MWVRGKMIATEWVKAGANRLNYRVYQLVFVANEVERGVFASSLPLGSNEDELGVYLFFDRLPLRAAPSFLISVPLPGLIIFHISSDDISK